MVNGLRFYSAGGKRYDHNDVLFIDAYGIWQGSVVCDPGNMEYYKDHIMCLCITGHTGNISTGGLAVYSISVADNYRIIQFIKEGVIS